ncbi:unnamed protein product [Cylindrotheca closterium]|uniref:Uncharacterized protein n=1 Tax=Cylindrotheca closterium TaxID=2856 RepID=A0AAD2JKB6_9STRA|nr:unnamed protein product [Cylindrotheca closterium]
MITWHPNIRPCEYTLKCNSLECDQNDRSIDVFSNHVTIDEVRDVSIETTAPYAIHAGSFDEVTLIVFYWDGSRCCDDFGSLCTGYNGGESAQLPNVPEANFWNGGANPGAGNTETLIREAAGNALILVM